MEVYQYSFFNFGNRLGWVVNNMFWLLYLRKEFWYPLYQRLGRLQGIRTGAEKSHPHQGFDSQTVEHEDQ